MVPSSRRKATPHQFYLPLRCCAPLRRFLLKRVEHVDNACETYGVDRPVGVRVKRCNDIENHSTAEVLQSLDRQELTAWCFGRSAYFHHPHNWAIAVADDDATVVVLEGGTWTSTGRRRTNN
jgi:hypothetical protein